MTKKEAQIKAKQLRREGLPITEIARRLHVAKSSVSLWTREIILPKTHLRKLRSLGSIKGWTKDERRTGKKIRDKKAKRDGEKRIGKMTKSKLLLTGLALYWGEGCKGEPLLLKLLTQIRM